MGQVLLEIEPRELKFTFELKKQSSCSVHLVNKSSDYVAFKVKTTSPKRYCVRPNTGVILPRSSCDFTVTMQAQKVAPPDMQLRDKFLIQGTVVPYGTTDEDVVPSFFSKENGRYIEENKLRVVLVSPPHSPVLQPINGALKQESVYEAPNLKETTLKETPVSNDQEVDDVKNLPLFHVSKEAEDLKLKLNDLEVKLNEAENTVTRLKEENGVAIQERDKLQQEIVLLRRKCKARIQVGFPFLFVVFMTIVGVALGYLLHP
ncbi:vesicle-associated protein 1-2-like [Phoenix dactylifera]|uniref:Vesicle-associated protein 1-2-like n=1 Tax=Phoenix dactylifera TaxID=42345 RepID=A0A8B7CP03_PHODC|nr:vesicle-associated protein 1-2-like [Phoenix dactylifera]XP_008803085.1 vesicle-associated protein 1-2-like [Phoenix dactylifera]